MRQLLACARRRAAASAEALAASLTPSRRLRSVSSPFSRLRPSSSKRCRAGVLGRPQTAARALSLTRRARRADEPRLGSRARQQGGDQRAGCDAAGKRDQRRFAERVGGARSRGAFIGFDRALAGEPHRSARLCVLRVRRSLGCLRVFRFRFRLAASCVVFRLSDAVDELAGEVDQRLTGKEHRDRRDHAGRGQRAASGPRRRHPRQGPRAFLLGAFARRPGRASWG